MAETVRIEIPVSVKDNTSAGVQSATRNMSNFERSMKRTEQQLNRLDRAHHVRVDADDQALQTYTVWIAVRTFARGSTFGRTSF